MRNKIPRQVDNYIGRYPTFKEARKNAREVARILNIHWAYIEVVKYKKDTYYVVKDDIDSHEGFDYYVHKDGRVCPRKAIQEEDKKWARHPERHMRSLPFSTVRNREPSEDKKSYKRAMNIGFPCNI